MKFIANLKKFVAERDEKEMAADVVGVVLLFVMLFIALIPGG